MAQRGVCLQQKNVCVLLGEPRTGGGGGVLATGQGLWVGGGSGQGVVDGVGSLGSGALSLSVSSDSFFLSQGSRCTKHAYVGRADSSKGFYHPRLDSGFPSLLPVTDSACDFVQGPSQCGLHSLSHPELLELRLKTLLELSVLWLTVWWLETLDSGLASNPGSAFSDLGATYLTGCYVLAWKIE